jgi:GT2 family glycosyltransferase
MKADDLDMKFDEGEGIAAYLDMSKARRPEHGQKVNVDVSIIIPVYKRTAWLGMCLDGLSTQDFQGSFEVIIVDDGSPNGGEIGTIADQYRSEGLLSLIFLRKENGGPAAARNFGVARSKGRILCFLDDDSIPDIGWLREITAPFRDMKGIGLVNGRTVSYDRISRLPMLLERAVYQGKCWATCNIAYQRGLFVELGGFDESFPEPSWEDNDLGLRARWKGAVHVYSEKAVVSHPHEASLDEYRDKCLLNGRGAAAFCRKHLKSKPWWSLITPLAMARRLPLAISPAVWFRRDFNQSYVKFLWSYHSLIGFIRAIASEPRNA